MDVVFTAHDLQCVATVYSKTMHPFIRDLLSKYSSDHVKNLIEQYSIRYLELDDENVIWDDLLSCLFPSSQHSVMMDPQLLYKMVFFNDDFHDCLKKALLSLV